MNDSQRKRWADVLLMAFFGGLSVAAVVYFNGWTKLTIAPPLWVYAVWASGTILVWTVLAVLSGWSLSVKRILNYPPTAFAIIFG